jgi:hypothetical protein
MTQGVKLCHTSGTHGSSLAVKPLVVSPGKPPAAAAVGGVKERVAHEYVMGEASPQQHQRARNAGGNTAVQPGGRNTAPGRSRNSLRYMLDKLGLDLGKVGV